MKRFRMKWGEMEIDLQEVSERLVLAALVMAFLAIGAVVCIDFFAGSGGF